MNRGDKKAFLDIILGTTTINLEKCSSGFESVETFYKFSVAVSYIFMSFNYVLCEEKCSFLFVLQYCDVRLSGSPLQNYKKKGSSDCRKKIYYKNCV